MRQALVAPGLSPACGALKGGSTVNASSFRITSLLPEVRLDRGGQIRGFFGVLSAPHFRLIFTHIFGWTRGLTMSGARRFSTLQGLNLSSRGQGRAFRARRPRIAIPPIPPTLEGLHLPDALQGRGTYRRRRPCVAPTATHGTPLQGACEPSPPSVSSKRFGTRSAFFGRRV